MFAKDNQDFLDAQRTVDPETFAMAARGAGQVLVDLQTTSRALPGCFRVDGAVLDELTGATRLLVDAQEVLLAHLAATRDPVELTAMFELPAPMAARIDWPTVAGAGLRMLRADIVPTQHGYVFCELNHFPGVGAGEAYHAAHTFAELLGRPVAGTSPFRELAALYRDAARAAGRTRVVVLDSVRHRRLGFGEHRMLNHYLHLMAPELEVVYHDELTYPAQWLAPAQAATILVHRLVTYDDTDDQGAFLDALHDSGALLSGRYEAELKMHRRWLPLLGDPAHQHLFDDAQRDAIARWLPRTVDVTPDEISRLVADRDGLVFKRSHTYGGKGVVMGEDLAAAELHTLLSADPHAWVAQQRVSAQTVSLPGPDDTPLDHHLVLGVYLYGDRPSGLLVRAAAGSSVVNVARGGGVSWAFPDPTPT